MISILTQGVDKNPFNFSYKNNDNTNMSIDLGNVLKKVSERVPGGILVFFPSYRVMNNCYETWQDTGLINEIDRNKMVLKEPKNSSMYEHTMQMYYNAIFEGDKQGAILMGVCRGRISEGLDFSDNAARLVVIVGIPYPQVSDARVVLKKDFLDRRS
jgi:Rad3-related DNA helicase